MTFYYLFNPKQGSSGVEPIDVFTSVASYTKRKKKKLNLKEKFDTKIRIVAPETIVDLDDWEEVILLLEFL